MPESVNALEQYYRDLGPATANPNFLAQGRRANVAQRSMPGPTMQAANTQLAKELGSMGNRGAIPDLINRGLIANTAGLPVDLLNTVLQSLGLGAEQPVGGSDSIRRALEYYGLSSDTQRPMLETLTGLTPPRAVMGAARAAGQGAEAVGRAAAPVAGQAIENYLVRSGGILPMHVYHGTPHRFPPTANNPLGEFDPMKIGTGEGAQAYGAGAGYLAENPQTARIYSADRAYVGSAMQGKPSTINFDDPAWLAQKTIDEFGDTSKATSHLKMVQRTAAKHQSPETKAQVQAAIDLLESGNIATKGSLYKVDLPDEQIAKMLDWDKPLSQQAAGKAALDFMPSIAKPNMTGQQFHDALVEQVFGSGKRATQDSKGALAAAKYMRYSLGIPGIKYLDADLPAGGGTSNFVVFDPKHMNIIGRE